MAGILSLPQAQWDAAKSLGMRRNLMLRIIIFPQALRLAAPPFVNLCINLIKATSLVSIVGLWELTMASREVVERTLAWITRSRRTVRDYERLPGHHETMIWWAMIITMSRRLAKQSRPPKPHTA